MRLTSSPVWLLPFILCIVVCRAAVQQSDLKAPSSIWALLVAGSRGWSNYRHQADIAHAYYVLRDHGVPESRIVVMTYDDVPFDGRNPYPGKLYNDPSLSREYRGGLKVDYHGEDVTRENFLAVLTGAESEVRGGNGRVLKSTAEDNVFVYYVDHGAPGFVEMPAGSVITKLDIWNAVASLYRRTAFNQIVFYVEACESGSLFEGSDSAPSFDQVYALTASNATEPSYGAYCVNLAGRVQANVCDLGETCRLQPNLLQLSLAAQAENVTKRCDSYQHVTSYGAGDFGSLPTGWFQGESVAQNGAYTSGDMHLVKSTEIEEWTLREEENVEELARFRAVRAGVAVLVERIVRRVSSTLFGERYSKFGQTNSTTNYLLDVTVPTPSIGTDIMQCHHDVVSTAYRNCFAGDYLMFRHASAFASVWPKICRAAEDLRVDPRSIVDALRAECSS